MNNRQYKIPQEEKKQPMHEILSSLGVMIRLCVALFHCGGHPDFANYVTLGQCCHRARFFGLYKGLKMFSHHSFMHTSNLEIHW